MEMEAINGLTIFVLIFSTIIIYLGGFLFLVLGGCEGSSRIISGIKFISLSVIILVSPAIPAFAVYVIQLGIRAAFFT